MNKRQNTRMSIDLVILYVKRLEQVQHVVFVKAYLSKCAKFDFYALLAYLLTKTTQRYAPLKSGQVL